MNKTGNSISRLFEYIVIDVLFRALGNVILS